MVDEEFQSRDFVTKLFEHKLLYPLINRGWALFASHPRRCAFLIQRVLDGPKPPARLIAELDPESLQDVAEARALIR